jgi:transposase
MGVCDSNIHPLTTLVCAGQANDNPLVLPVVDQVAIRMPSGQIRRRPKKVVGDKGCSSKNNRDGLRKRGITPVIAYKSNEKGASHPFDSTSYKKRNVIERMFGNLKECRRIATRYEKLAVRYHAFVKIACIRYLLTKL